jgi:hypothetical protein
MRIAFLSNQNLFTAYALGTKLTAKTPVTDRLMAATRREIVPEPVPGS